MSTMNHCLNTTIVICTFQQQANLFVMVLSSWVVCSKNLQNNKPYYQITTKGF